MSLHEPETRGRFVSSDSREWLIVSSKPLGAAIRDIVLDVTKIGYRDFVSASRYPRLVNSRHIFFYLARKHAGLSLPQIGRIAGGRDHSTASHGINKVTAAPDYFQPMLGECEKRVLRVMEERGLERNSQPAEKLGSSVELNVR